ncbi:YHYH protein [Nemorincola caseinilytica]
MNRKTLLLAIMLLSSRMLTAQVTDPMIINWWFNTTGHTYSGILTDVEAVYYTTATVYVKTSGVPNYYMHGVTHNDATDLDATWTIPRVPTPATTPMGVMGGQIGLMLDGSVFFHPGDAQSYMNAGVWNRLAYYFEGMDMDASNGHSTPTNMYHHHFDNLKLHGWDATQHSPIVAYAWDGYPVYGPYGYANADGTGGITRIRSGYVTKTYTTRTSGPAVDASYPIGCFIEDWQYTASAGDLDAHNGRFCKTPEYPAGTYAYFTTVDAALKPAYPYFIGPTFYGAFSNTNTGPTGGHTTVPGTATPYTPTKVKEIAAIEAGIKLYPVPVVTDLTIELQENKPYTVTVFDVKGTITSSKKITATTTVDMSTLPYGVYFVQVADEANGTGFVKRIVKQ